MSVCLFYFNVKLKRTRLVGFCHCNFFFFLFFGFEFFQFIMSNDFFISFLTTNHDNAYDTGIIPLYTEKNTLIMCQIVSVKIME